MALPWPFVAVDALDYPPGSSFPLDLARFNYHLACVDGLGADNLTVFSRFLHHHHRAGFYFTGRLSVDGSEGGSMLTSPVRVASGTFVLVAVELEHCLSLCQAVRKSNGSPGKAVRGAQVFYFLFRRPGRPLPTAHPPGRRSQHPSQQEKVFRMHLWQMSCVLAPL